MATRPSLKTSFLPQETIAFFKRRVRELVGVSFLLLTVWVILSVTSYTPNDASLNTATDTAVHNLMLYPGAIVADLMLQSFGMSSFLLPLIMGIWGVRLILQQRLSVNAVRLTNTLASSLFLSIFLTYFYHKENSFLLKLKLSMTGFKTIPMGGTLGEIFFFNWQNFLVARGYQSILPFTIFIIGFVFLSLTWHAIGLKIEDVVNTIGRFYFSVASLLNRVASGKKTQPGPMKKEVRFKADPLIDLRFQETSLESLKSTLNLTSSENYDDEPAIEIDEEMVSDSLEYEFRHSAANDEYQLPPIDLLDPSRAKSTGKMLSQDELEQSAKQLEVVLAEFGVRGEIVNIRPGPVVTLYELRPAAGIKTSRVIGLADDIARSMSALSARIAVIPGHNVIGIELPNPTRQTVYMRDLLLTPEYHNFSMGLSLILGKDIGGKPIIADLTKMPHLLVAGTTGSGKSVSVNTMILSLLFRFPPDRCKFIMIDPKMLELSVYDEIPHLLAPVVTDPKKAVVALKWAVREMENRYRAMAKLGVRNIEGYNVRLEEARSTGEILLRRVQTGFDPDSGKPVFENQTLNLEPLPFIVVVVDEMADLMLVAGKEIEGAVQRLAQMARAAGIHLIMATQRPSVDVITGTIKANFPTRISFQVTSKIDSRTILGEQGAEQLLGQGDMLYMVGGGRIIRVHGPFVKDDEVERIVKFLKTQGEPSYLESVTEDDSESQISGSDDSSDKGGDALYRQALDIVMREGKASTSFIQRHLQIGYNRAARIVDQMEKEGIISSANHVGKREIIGRG